MKPCKTSYEGEQGKAQGHSGTRCLDTMATVVEKSSTLLTMQPAG